MTIYAVLAIRDTSMARFTPPMTMPSVPYGVRSFRDEVNRNATDNNMNRHPEDFELWHIADWNEETAQYSAPTSGELRCVARAKDLWESNGANNG